MSVGLLLLIILGVAIALGTTTVVSSALSSGAGDAKRELRASKAREKIATAALRQIANGDTMPVLTAGDALDRIESDYLKELN
jgi:hypothetical protein